MRNDKLGFGCSTRLLLVGALMVLVFGGVAYQLIRFISGPEQVNVAVSSVAAQSCREKFNTFATNEYVRTVTLTDIEINSALHEDIGKRFKYFSNPWVGLTENGFTLGGRWAAVNLLVPQEERSPLDVETEEESFWDLWGHVEVSGDVSVMLGELRIHPNKIVLGKISLPDFMIKFFEKKWPRLFKVYISSEVKQVKLKSGAIELLKDLDEPENI